MMRVLVTAAVVVLAGAGTVAAWSGHDEPVQVVAVFPDASPLRAGNEVKAHGVRVGLIDEVVLVDGKAQVRATLDTQLPMRANASAAIRPVSLLGERFLELDPGTAGAVVDAAADGPVVIPPERTSRAVDLDDLLDTLDDPTSAALAALVTSLGEGAAGRGDDISAAVSALAPAMTDTGRLAEVLDAQNALLGKAIDSQARILVALGDDDGQSLDALVSATTRTLDTVAANRDAVDAALVRLPGTIDSTRRTLGELTATAEATTPVLRDLRPTTSQLDGIAGDVLAFTAAADPALDALQPVLDRTRALLDQARPVADGLRPAANDLRSASGDLATISDRMLVHDPGVPSGLELLLDGIADWAMGTSGRDGLSHYFRGAAVATPETFRSLLDAAAPEGVIPDELPEPIASLPPAPAAPQQEEPTDPGSVTGLAPEQESDLVDQFLGGR